jgi:hypothetical protein
MLWWNRFVSEQFLQFVIGVFSAQKNVGSHRCVSWPRPKSHFPGTEAITDC